MLRGRLGRDEQVLERERARMRKERTRDEEIGGGGSSAMTAQFALKSILRQKERTASPRCESDHVRASSNATMWRCLADDGAF